MLPAVRTGAVTTTWAPRRRSAARGAAAVATAAVLVGLAAGPALAAQATGHDPRDSGGTDLVAQLTAAGPAPRQSAAAKKSGSDSSPLWMAGVGALAGIGGGLFISLNRKRGQAGQRPESSGDRRAGH
ncbi:hypothetical protein ACIGXM_31460 [Kitasatospora sp. NPDC052896]|uniref:hypothetical protein n=1 Tax=Kitasatospora sp. NPDC052896 TaxID=3364061 RepID=UPI0037C8BEAA